VKLEIVHRTEYVYDNEVSESYNEAHLVPRGLADQSCLLSELVIDPRPADYRERFDFFGNRTSFFSISQPHHRLTVTATSVVDIHDRYNQPKLALSEPWESARDRLELDSDPEVVTARQYVLPSPLITTGPVYEEFAQSSFTPGRPLVEAVLDLSHRINSGFAYRPGTTSITTRLDEVLQRREGVCQDFAHLAIACLRTIGLPARYVSGYLETEAPPGEQKLAGVDASHAWLSVFVPDAGWLDIDPTNDQVPDDRYITTAWGRDYADVTPLKGVVFSHATTHTLTVSVDVSRQTP
jgi:transglutaminase-like putative cysteine protease